MKAFLNFSAKAVAVLRITAILGIVLTLAQGAVLTSVGIEDVSTELGGNFDRLAIHQLERSGSGFNGCFQISKRGITLNYPSKNEDHK